MLEYDSLEPPLTADLLFKQFADLLDIYFGNLTAEVHNGAFTGKPKQPWDYYPSTKKTKDSKGNLVPVEKQLELDEKNKLRFFTCKRFAEMRWRKRQEEMRQSNGGG